MNAVTVLVVEDNERNMKLIRDVLQFSGYRVITADNAEAGVAAAQAEAPALILMDLQLPGIDGHSALAQLRASPQTRTVPVVAVTALAMDEDRERARNAGFDGYITKPINTRELPGLVAMFIGGEGTTT